jgi:hypothetical protein
MSEADTYLDSVESIVMTLGGYTAAGRIFGVRPQDTYNWVMAGKFPTRTYLAFEEILRELGFDPQPELWGMIPREDWGK